MEFSMNVKMTQNKFIPLDDHVYQISCKSDLLEKSPIMMSWRPSWNFTKKKVTQYNYMHLDIRFRQERSLKGQANTTPTLKLAWIIVIVQNRCSNFTQMTRGQRPLTVT